MPAPHPTDSLLGERLCERAHDTRWLYRSGP